MKPGLLTVSVVYCPHGLEDLNEVQLEAGSTVADAIAASHLVSRWPLLQVSLDAGIWGKRCSLQQPVNDGDRVEIYRPLKVDPKQARRGRAEAQRGQARQGSAVTTVKAKGRV